VHVVLEQVVPEGLPNQVVLLHLHDRLAEIGGKALHLIPGPLLGAQLPHIGVDRGTGIDLSLHPVQARGQLYGKGEVVHELPVWKGSADHLPAGFSQDFYVTVPKGHWQQLQAQLESMQPLLAPVRAGQSIGMLRLTFADERYGEYPLVALESEGYTVIPTARAAQLTMNREGIRRLAAEELGIKTSPYRFASSREEFDQALKDIGIPCVVKPIMSSSGKGQSTIKRESDIDKAWNYAQEGGRTGAEVMNQIAGNYGGGYTMQAYKKIDDAQDGKHQPAILEWIIQS